MKRAVALAAIVVLAACGGSGEVAERLEVGDIARKIGCSAGERTQPMLSREELSCEREGEQITITTFNSTEQRDDALEAFGSMMSGAMVRGDLWIVTGVPPEDADEIQAVLGGEVV